jgi:hypothetical protein
MANLDWIDELDNKEDDLTNYQLLQRAIYQSRMGFAYWWPRIIAMVEDDAYSSESGLINATDSKEETMRKMLMDGKEPKNLHEDYTPEQVYKIYLGAGMKEAAKSYAKKHKLKLETNKKKA